MNKEDMEVKLKVMEALQEEAYKGIVRIDAEAMRKIKVRPGDIVSIEGGRKTVGIVDRAYPTDVGEIVIRMDGILRRNARTGISEIVKVSKADVKEAKAVTIAPVQKGILIQAHPELFKRGLLGRAIVRGDIVALGGAKRRRRTSEYGIQLREKQKAKRIYGILERQFKKYIIQANKVKGATGLSLLHTLETRLDNVVYRLGFSKSRAGARQLVSHGHIKVDGKKVAIPSYQVKADQTIAISDKLLDNTQVKKSLEDEEALPKWLERQATMGKVLRKPERDEMEQSVDEQLIVEYYSR